MKIRLILSLLAIVLVVVVLWGCGASTHNDTTSTTTTAHPGTLTATTTGSTNTTTPTSVTTTVSGSTTSTLGPYKISGTVSGLNSWGTLGIWVCRDAFVSDPVGGAIVPVASVQPSAAFTTNGLENGTYYVLGILYKGRTLTGLEQPKTNDKLGEYLDGYVPLNLDSQVSQAHVGTPQQIVISGADVHSINFTLNATWTATTP
ncbi:MAG: hypothetical protein PHH60_03460 [Candidatus Margulisbacteria bacterium]|nr:hypothetical protein [Candidatus Margulisiibacteriota bacterium]